MCLDMNVLDKIETAKLKKQAQNRLFYEDHKNENHRASLLCAVQTRGRVPKLQSIQKYNIEIAELVDKWRHYCASRPREEIRPLKILKMQALIMNMV